MRWLGRARELATAERRLAVADSHIGKVLAFAPSDADGTWPVEAVRDALEKLTVESLQHGVEIGIYNRRGAHFVQKGGVQELRLRDKFRGFADKVRSRWPHTASILDRIAKHYEQDAERQIEEEKLGEFEG